MFTTVTAVTIVTPVIIVAAIRLDTKVLAETLVTIVIHFTTVTKFQRYNNGYYC